MNVWANKFELPGCMHPKIFNINIRVTICGGMLIGGQPRPGEESNCRWANKGTSNLVVILRDNLGEGTCESIFVARQWGVNSCVINSLSHCDLTLARTPFTLVLQACLLSKRFHSVGPVGGGALRCSNSLPSDQKHHVLKKLQKKYFPKITFFTRNFSKTSKIFKHQRFPE